jgi:hypothetical protein
MGRTIEEEKQILEAAHKQFESLYLPKNPLFAYCRKLYGKQSVVPGIIEKHEHGKAARPSRSVFRIPPRLLQNPNKYEESDRRFEHDKKITKYAGTIEPDLNSEDYYVSQVLQNLEAVEPGLLKPRTKVRMRDSEGKVLEIDLLCEGADGKFVVIELKRLLRTPLEIAAQTIEYMGMIIRQEGRKDCVRGYMLVGRRYHATEMAELVVGELRVKLYSEVLPNQPAG